MKRRVVSLVATRAYLGDQSDMPTHKTDEHRLERYRQLVLSVLTGERTADEDPALMDDDLLYFAGGALGQSDPGWLLSRLLDQDFDYEARMTVFSQLSGSPRFAAIPLLRAENPSHEAWHYLEVLRQLPTPPDAESVGEAAVLLLEQLTAGSIQQRDRAAEELGDLASNLDRPAAVFTAAAEGMLQRALVERDPVVGESLLNALAELANVGDRTRIDSVDWSPLAALLERVDDPHLLEHAFDALAAIGHRQHRSAVRRATSHRLAEVREAAATALRELDRE